MKDKTKQDKTKPAYPGPMWPFPQWKNGKIVKPKRETLTQRLAAAEPAPF